MKNFKMQRHRDIDYSRAYSDTKGKGLNLHYITKNILLENIIIENCSLKALFKL